jgi:uncharacterized protein YndB with AHSA1/START domain
MPVTAVLKDPEALTMTVVAEFAASRERVWEAYADPRQLERFWGWPEYPATFLRHDMYPGGQSVWFLQGPDGPTPHFVWHFVDVQPGRSFEARDGGMLDESGQPVEDGGPSRMVFEFADTETGCTVTTMTYFDSADALQRMIDMASDEELAGQVGRIDAVLADLRTFAADIPTHTQVLDATSARISRVIRGSVADVWRAHHEPELLKQWLLGPDGWEMPVCTAAEKPGDRYRREWAPLEGNDGQAFGFVGEVLESEPPHRAVVREWLIGMEEGPGVEFATTFTTVPAGTLLVHVMTCPDPQTLETMLATGMTDGMEASYRRLESTVLAG